MNPSSGPPRMLSNENILHVVCFDGTAFSTDAGVMQPLNFNLNFNLKLQVLKFRPGPGILNFKV